MIQLKARDGHILYTAETATDVRTALQEAVLRGANLYSADLYGANLYGANLYGANLYGANLYGADLRSADLRSADLYGADLRSADLYGADLRSANLSSANLRRAIGVIPERTHPLHMLFDQVGKIRAYKLVSAEGRSPIQRTSTLLYEHGKTVEVRTANTDPSRECAAGVNVATLDWCLANHQPGQRILIVEFTKADIAAIPNTTDGKFRVFRCKVVGEKDLSTLGVA